MLKIYFCITHKTSMKIDFASIWRCYFQNNNKFSFNIVKQLFQLHYPLFIFELSI